MRIRVLLTLTAIVSAIIGAVVAYLALTVPNDVQAAALMRSARREIAAGDNVRARASLERIVQQYPRTDAAAAATVALASLLDNEQQQMLAEIAALRKETEAQQKDIDGLTERLEDLASRPLPRPVVQPPAPPPPRKKTVARPRRRH